MTTPNKNNSNINTNINTAINSDINSCIKSSAMLQSGFTLIELMVAMTISLIIAAGAVALFANTIWSTNTLNSATAINESATRTNEMLARHFRMTGYVDWLSNSELFGATSNEAVNVELYNLKASGKNSLFQTAFAASKNVTANAIPRPLSGCDGTVNVPANPLNNTACATGSNPMLSAVTVAYQVTSEPTIWFSPTLPNPNDSTVANRPASTTGMARDCNNETPTQPYAVNQFYLSLNRPSDWRAGDPDLYDLMCLGNSASNTPQPLVSNVEQWVVRYGVPALPSATASGSVANDAQVAQYFTAAQVTTNQDWNRVTAIRSCIMIAGTRGSATVTNGATSSTNTTRRDCEGNFIKTKNDLRLRQAFTQTVTVRNQIHTPNLVF